jgi:hypothetical protein
MESNGLWLSATIWLGLAAGASHDTRWLCVSLATAASVCLGQFLSNYFGWYWSGLLGFLWARLVESKDANRKSKDGSQ